MKISKRTRDFISYLVGGTVVIAGTLLLIAIANGWQYNIFTGEITETGLILMGSEPTGATITVNNERLPQKTNFRYSNAPIGNYEIRYEKDKFRPWTSLTAVQAGQVTFVDHAWLIPNKIPARRRYEELQITQATQTQDRKRFVLVDNTTPTAPRLFTSTDLKRPLVPLATNAQLTASVGLPVTGIDSIQFSDDSTKILFRATLANNNSQWLIATVNNNDQPAIVNISQTLLITPTWISWVPRGNNEIIYTEKNILRRAQIHEKNISGILAENVIFAEWSDDWLIFITNQASTSQATTTQKLFIRPVDASTNEEVTTLATAGQAFTARYIRTADRDYIALLNKDQGALTLYTGIFRNRDRRTESVIGHNVSAITLSPNNRFLVHNARNHMVTLDLERFKHYNSNLSLEGLTDWSWMNDQHLAIKLGADLKLVDYDGQNSELITKISPTSPILFFGNKTLLYLRQEDSRSYLTQSYLDPEKFTE